MAVPGGMEAKEGPIVARAEGGILYVTAAKGGRKEGTGAGAAAVKGAKGGPVEGDTAAGVAVLAMGASVERARAGATAWAARVQVIGLSKASDPAAEAAAGETAEGGRIGGV